MDVDVEDNANKLVDIYYILCDIDNDLYDMYDKGKIPNEHIRDFIICAMENIRKILDNK
jgi:hypothetical protein